MTHMPCYFEALHDKLEINLTLHDWIALLISSVLYAAVGNLFEIDACLIPIKLDINLIIQQCGFVSFFSFFFFKFSWFH